MLENGLNYVTELLDVVHLKWGENRVNVSKRNYSALAFRIKGKALIDVGDKQYCAYENDILYMPQNTSYIAEYSDTEIMVIHFKTICNDSLPEVYSINNPEQIYCIFLKMQVLWEKKSSGYQAEIMSLLYNVLAEISKRKCESGLRTDYLKGISFINANFKNRNISVPQICKEAGMSETNFRKYMKLYCGKTPVEYLTQLRLEYARNLIAYGVPIKQSALESGFSDPKYFSRMVKKYFGCTAKALR